MGDKKVVKHIDEAITGHVHGSKLKTRIARKHGWTIRDLDLVDWESLRLVTKSDTAADNLWKMKMASRFVPVGKRMLLYRKWDNSLCPCCSKCEETVEHLLCCQELGSQLLRRQKFESFDSG